MNIPWTPTLVPASFMRDIVVRVENKQLTGTHGKKALLHVLQTPPDRSKSLDEILASLDLVISSDFNLEEACQKAIDAYPSSADAIKGGHHGAIGRLMGHIMKEAKGGADAQQARAIIFEKLGVKA